MARKRKKQAPAQPAPVAVSSADKTKKIVIIVISALIGIAILIGAALGIILGVRNASYAIVVDGVGITEGVANYLSAYFKANYKAILQNELSSAGIVVVDEEKFWSQKIHPDVATTYGDYLKIYVENAIKSLASANAIFNSAVKLDYDDRVEIAVATEEILEYQAGGDKTVFNRECEKYGFDYDDFVSATEILYKGAMLKSKLFGSSGEKMALYPEERLEFFSDFVRVKLLFIRTDKKISYINGEPQLNEDGTYKFEQIVEGSGEYQERMEDIARLQGIINGEYDTALFDELWQKYANENDKALYGCYLNEKTKFTENLKKKYDAVVSEALTLEEGDLSRVDDSASDDNNTFIGTVFIYCDTKEANAYSKPDEHGYFEDFNSVLASTVMENMIDEKQKSVQMREKWEAVDIIKIPYLQTFVASF